MILSLALGRAAAADRPKGEDLSLTWKLVRNYVDDQNRFRASLTLTNRSSQVLENLGWTIYFSLGRHVFPESVTAGAAIERMTGDFCRLTPTAQFEALQPGKSVTIAFEGRPFIIKHSDAPKGMYIVFTNEAGEEEVPENITDVTIEPYRRPEQLHRNRGDKIPLATPEWRFQLNESLTLLNPSELPLLLPTPRSVRKSRRHMILDGSYSIHYQNGLAGEANFLAEALREDLGLSLPVKPDDGSERRAVSLVLRAGRGDVEGYVLTITPGEGIEISGSDPAGVFYGLQSLRALIPLEAYGRRGAPLILPEVEVRDSPRFRYRGMHLDVSRNFQSSDAVRKLLDVMAFYKMNRLHLHVADDEGWRLEIKGLPELTRVGAHRGHTLTEDRHLQPSFGSGPFPDPQVSHGSGYYSRSEFIDILRYAKGRHIQVIVEIDLPGHARAAIKAMEARYRNLLSQGDALKAEQYLLSDPEDESEYRSVQNYPDNVICVCRDSTYDFLDYVLGEIVSMYRAAEAPLETVHIGGDEVPRGVWEKSPECGRFLKTHPEETDLFAYFVGRMHDMLQSQGLSTAGWEEIGLKKVTVDGRARHVPDPELAGELLLYIWNNLGANRDLAYRLANAGYQVVLCNVTNLYFDLAYDKDPREPGFYWGGFVDTRKAFELTPFDVFQSTYQDAFGNPYDTGAMGMQRLRPGSYENILGIQGQLWSETIRGREMLEYYLLPKMLGLAERAWAARPRWAAQAGPARRDGLGRAWNLFANSLGQRELARLDHIDGGFNYRIPPPGAVVRSNILSANVGFPGLIIRYSTDGDDPTADSPVYSGPVKISGAVKLRAFSPKGRGSLTMEIP
jgi:hexosaminidase